MITVLSKDACPGCVTAVQLLKEANIEHEVLKLGVDFTRDWLFENHPTVRSVPYILKDGEPIGGLKELQRFLG